MECGTKLIKTLLLVFNAIFTAAGIALVLVGGFTQSQLEKYDDLLTSSGFQALSISIVVLGIIVFSMGLIGCYGSITESHSMMSMYLWALTLLLILQVVAAVVAGLCIDDVDSAVKTGFAQSMSRYGNSSKITGTWDSIQEGMKCCGTVQYTDWEILDKNVPGSCCVAGEEKCPADGLPSPILNPTLVFAQGCYERAVNAIGMSFLAGVCAGIAAVELVVLMCCRCWLAGCCLPSRSLAR